MIYIEDDGTTWEEVPMSIWNALVTGTREILLNKEEKKVHFVQKTREARNIAENMADVHG